MQDEINKEKWGMDMGTFCTTCTNFSKSKTALKIKY